MRQGPLEFQNARLQGIGKACKPFVFGIVSKFESSAKFQVRDCPDRSGRYELIYNTTIFGAG
jgi:hypothetical protein